MPLEQDCPHRPPAPNRSPQGGHPLAKGMFQLQPAAGSRADAPKAAAEDPGAKTAPRSGGQHPPFSLTGGRKSKGAPPFSIYNRRQEVLAAHPSVRPEAGKV